MRRKWIFLAPLAILGILLFCAIGGEVVRLLWNWLMPPLFGWREITFWQALGLLALCRILFGGHGYHRRSSRTPEERERFRQAMRRRWGIGQPVGEHGIKN
jgi:hypothetical protein